MIIFIRQFLSGGLALVFLLLNFSCERSYAPKPRGYVRIALPEKEYRAFDTIFPYSFSYPGYAVIRPDTHPLAEPWWANIYFPQFSAIIHLTYRRADEKEKLNEFFEDGREFVNKHIPKSTGFNERIYVDENARVYGILYEITGPEAASPLQFYLTDSISHFLRGALYFNVTPNNDSLAPVINFIKDDIYTLIETLTWKQGNPL